MSSPQPQRRFSESGGSLTTINSPQTGESPVPLPEMLSGFHRRAR